MKLTAFLLFLSLSCCVRADDDRRKEQEGTTAKIVE